MNYKLRKYQQEAVERAIAYFSDSKTEGGLIVLPTGAGKSLVIANIALRIHSPLLILQPNKEILEQNYKKLSDSGIIDVEVFSASCNHKRVAKTTFATIGSVRPHTGYFSRFRHVVIDECHCVNPNEGMYKEFIDAIKCKVVGLTATPYRLCTKQGHAPILQFLTQQKPAVFRHLLHHIEIRQLQKDGHLAQLNYYELNIVQPSKLKCNSTQGDFSESSIRRHYEEIKFHITLERVVRELLASGRTSILVFTRFLDEARQLSEGSNGEIAIVCGETPKKERERILKNFKERRINVVANVGVLTTGFDFPELSTVVLARPTFSLAMYYQMCGRVIRPALNKTGWIVDLCGNIARFGRLEDLRLSQTLPNEWAVFSGNKRLTGTPL